MIKIYITQTLNLEQGLNPGWVLKKCIESLNSIKKLG